MKNSERILQALTSWPGVSTHSHRFGGTEYRLGNRELGHVHGEGLVDIPFPRRVRDEVIARGEAVRHHVLPESGWISVYLREPEDIERALSLLERSYTLARAQAERKEAKVS